METKILIIAAILLIFSSCKKDDDTQPKPEPPKINKLQTLLGSDWKMIKYEKLNKAANSPMFSITDFFETNECYRNNTVKFYDTGYSLITDDCYPPTDSVDWKFISDSTKFIFMGFREMDFYQDTFDISSFTKDSIILRNTDTFFYQQWYYQTHEMVLKKIN